MLLKMKLTKIGRPLAKDLTWNFVTLFGSLEITYGFQHGNSI